MDELAILLGEVDEGKVVPKLFNSDIRGEVEVGKELGLVPVLVHGIEVLPKSIPANSKLPERNFDKHKFCEMLSLGLTEEESLDVVNVLLYGDEKHAKSIKMGLVVQLRVKDEYFEEMVKEAKRLRADHWFNGIIKSTRKFVGKDEAAGEKLKFEQRKYLAAIDNPEKYNEKKGSVDVNVNVFGELKRMKASDAKRMIEAFDPFIDAEFEEVREWSSEHVVGVEGDSEWVDQEVEE